MTRYALCGHLTGDKQSKARRWFPNLYVHQMHAPDLDPSLHDHPWPWAVSFILLGGYLEERLEPRPLWLLNGSYSISRSWQQIKAYGNIDSDLDVAYYARAPGQLNFLSGGTFHRIAELPNPGHTAGQRGPLASVGRRPAAVGEGSQGCSGSCLGTWTLFMAGPGRNKKQWGYVVEGVGYVPHAERHASIEGKEVREPEPLKPAKGRVLDLLALVVGLERRKRCRLFGLLNESDKALRQRIHETMVWLR